MTSHKIPFISLTYYVFLQNLRLRSKNPTKIMISHPCNDPLPKNRYTHVWCSSHSKYPHVQKSGSVIFCTCLNMNIIIFIIILKLFTCLVLSRSFASSSCFVVVICISCFVAKIKNIIFFAGDILIFIHFSLM